MRIIVTAWVIISLLAACHRRNGTCDPAVRALEDGQEEVCEKAGIGRVGPYEFHSPTLQISGAYIDGARDGEWEWAPRGTAPILFQEFDRGVLVAQREEIDGLTDGIAWRIVTPEVGRPVEIDEYDCGFRIWNMIWSGPRDYSSSGATPDLASEPPVPSESAHAACLADRDKLRSSSRRHPLLPTPSEPPAGPPSREEIARGCRVIAQQLETASTERKLDLAGVDPTSLTLDRFYPCASLHAHFDGVLVSVAQQFSETADEFADSRAHQDAAGMTAAINHMAALYSQVNAWPMGADPEPKR